MTMPAIPDESPDFSLVLGGPLFQFFRRAHLCGGRLELLHRRVVVIAIVAWVPLLLLSAIGGHLLGGPIKVPFLYDIEVHVRFLIALPILVVAELIVHSRISPAVKNFVDRNIVTEDMRKFQAAIDSSRRLRDSFAVEVALMILVYTLGTWIWSSNIATSSASWYAVPAGSQLHFTFAGYWYAFVSIPIFQFILVRWYFRFFLWFQFLWRVSRLKLKLIATHPDRAGGLGFLGHSTYAFGPILFAQGAILAGIIAGRVLYDGQSLLALKMEAAGCVIFFVVVILSPLLVFIPCLMRAKRQGLRTYGSLASRYVEGFEKKWVNGDDRKGEEFIGSADIQSLADMGNSFAVVQEMRLVPFGLKNVARLSLATAAPMLPVMLTTFSVDEVMMRVITILF